MPKNCKLEIFYNISSAIPRNCIATVGFFDGVHLGHQYIIRRIKEEAEVSNTQELIVTLSPHPAVFFGKHIELLSTFDEKIALLENCGVKNLLVLPFNKELAQLSGTEFIEQLLVKQVGISKLVLGFNNSIGHKENGRSEISTSSINVERLEKFTIDKSDDISSSSIRNLLKQGDIFTANRYLGYNYSLCGKVVHGKALGRTMNFPTANLVLEDSEKCLPANGVYAVEVEIDSRQFCGMLNIGTCPTFGGNVQTIELNILNFSADIYGQEVKLAFRKHLRKEQKFASKAELMSQLEKDKAEVQKYFITDKA